MTREEAKRYIIQHCNPDYPNGSTEWETAMNMAIEALEQPEIIRCKDCKHWYREIHNGIEYFNFSFCNLNHCGDGHNFYCDDAERKEGEKE